MNEEQIFEIVRQWLGQVNAPSEQLVQYARQTGRSIPFDYVSTIDNKEFYIIIKQNTNLLRGTQQSVIQQLSELVHLRMIPQAPLITVTQIDNTCRFGFMIYWDYDKCYLNNNIYWRELTQESLGWLSIQLKANRQRIVSLPNNYLRIVKTISLETQDMVEAEVVYLRKFSPTYHMSSPPMLSDQERFNRLLTGTPEKEYPEDELDRLILTTIQASYPQAIIKSKILLFDVDLIKYRHLKDKRFEQHTINYVAIRYDQNGQIIGPGERNFRITLDFYYYPNVFKSNGVRLISLVNEIDEQLTNQYTQLLNAYEPLSAINI